MSGAILLFSALILTFAIALVLSVVLAVQVLRRLPERWPRRMAMALFVPWGAMASWRAGRHALPAAWALSIAAYVALRIVAAAANFA
jgi:hypothetical protein